MTMKKMQKSPTRTMKTSRLALLGLAVSLAAAPAWVLTQGTPAHAQQAATQRIVEGIVEPVVGQDAMHLPVAAFISHVVDGFLSSVFSHGM